MAVVRAGTEAATAIATIVAANALGALKSNTVFAQIVNRNFDEEVADHGRTLNIPVRGALTAVDKAEGTDVTWQAPTTTTVAVTLDKHKVVPFAVEDIAIMLARPDLVAGYGVDAGIAIAEVLDGDIAALYSGLSQTIDASAGLDEEDFREAQRLLNAAKAPQANRWAVLHEDAYYEANSIAKLIHRDYQGDDALEAVREGYLGKLNGFNVLMDQNIKVATTCKNIFMQENAIVLVTRPMRQTSSGNVTQVVMSEGGITVRVTTSYDHAGFAERMSVDCLYGVAEMRDDHGVVVSTTEQ